MLAVWTVSIWRVQRQTKSNKVSLSFTRSYSKYLEPNLYVAPRASYVDLPISTSKFHRNPAFQILSPEFYHNTAFSIIILKSKPPVCCLLTPVHLPSPHVLHFRRLHPISNILTLTKRGHCRRIFKVRALYEIHRNECGVSHHRPLSFFLFSFFQALKEKQAHDSM
jgi:hypothetical protein